MGGKSALENAGTGEEKMRKNFKLSAIGYKLSAIVFLFSLIAGCGYTTRSMVSTKYRTIYVAPFVNKIDITSESYTQNKFRIYRPLLETDVTKGVINKFLFDGNLKPGPEGTADLILKSELMDFRKDTLRYDANDNVEEYRINIVVNMSLWDRQENKLVWEENGFTGETHYFTSGPNAKSEGTAINDAITDLARRIVERAVEQW